MVRSERDMAVAEQKTLQQTITSLEQDKQVYETGVCGVPTVWGDVYTGS